VNFQIRNLPYKDEYVIVTRGKGKRTELGQKPKGKGLRRYRRAPRKFEQKTQGLKQQGQSLVSKVSQKIDEAKGKIKEQAQGFKQQVQSHSLGDDQPSKESLAQLKKINKEVESRPHRKEEVFECQGQGPEGQGGIEALRQKIRKTLF